MLEDQEENLLDWFKTKQKILVSQLFSDICVDQTKFCCPKDHFGPECRQCPQLNGQVCSGNGNCDGEGTRDGSGKCKCNKAFAGEFCSSCSNGFYEKTKNQTSIECAECYWSCLTCSGPEQSSCLSCKNGWKFNSETNLCDDINECLEEKKCGLNEYCENVQGSYECKKCDASCQECSGPGSDKCTGQCFKGYEKIADACVDIDECQQNQNLCPDSECVNIAGSYQCQGNLTFNFQFKKNNYFIFYFCLFKATDKNKNNDKETKNQLIKRSFIIGVMILSMLSSYFTKQYFLTLLSFLFGSLILFLIN